MSRGFISSGDIHKWYGTESYGREDRFRFWLDVGESLAKSEAKKKAVETPKKKEPEPDIFIDFGS